MIVCDDAIPVTMQNRLLDLCTNPEFPWSFLLDATFDRDDTLAKKMNKPTYPSFCHLAMMGKVPKSHTFDYFSDIIECISEKSKNNIDDLYRIRFGLYLPIKNSPPHNNIHVDMKIPHVVCLYYVNDSDGDTFFFDTNRQIVKTISPKKGRMVIFDGLTLHASSMPSNNFRISLNINYVHNN